MHTQRKKYQSMLVIFTCIRKPIAKLDAKLDARLRRRGGWGPAPKPRCEFGESRIPGENTYIFTSMTQTSMQKKTIDRALNDVDTTSFVS